MGILKESEAVSTVSKRVVLPRAVAMRGRKRRRRKKVWRKRENLEHMTVSLQPTKRSYRMMSEDDTKHSRFQNMQVDNRNPCRQGGFVQWMMLESCETMRNVLGWSGAGSLSISDPRGRAQPCPSRALHPDPYPLIYLAGRIGHIYGFTSWRFGCTTVSCLVYCDPLLLDLLFFLLLLLSLFN